MKQNYQKKAIKNLEKAVAKQDCKCMGCELKKINTMPELVGPYGVQIISDQEIERELGLQPGTLSKRY